MNYILDESGDPVMEPDLLRWAKWFQTHSRQVAEDFVAGYRISTVFLAIDHRLWRGLNDPPILWETMIFATDELDDLLRDDYQERYSSEKDAVEGHKRAVEYVRNLQKH